MQKHINHSLLLKAVTLCVSCVLLFIIELLLAGRDAAVQQTPYMVLTATLFFALSTLGSLLYKVVMQQGGKRAISYYLLDKVVRLFLTIVLMVLYAFANGSNLLLFAINLLVLYMVSIITSIIFYAKVEHHISKKQ